MFGNDWLISHSRIRNAILVLSIDLEMVFFANNKVPDSCVACCNVAADLDILLSNFTFLNNVVGDGRSTSISR